MHKTVVKLSLPSLNPGAHFFSFLINVFCGIFFLRIEQFHLLKNLFRQISFLLNDFLRGVWEFILCLFVSRSCISPYLDIFFKPKLFLKLSNHPSLALNSPALNPSPAFCFKLSNMNKCHVMICFFSNHIRIYRYAFLIATLYLHESHAYNTR